MKGCLGPTKIPLFEFDGVDYYECPLKLISQDTASFLAVFNMCKLFNALPAAGGVMNQTQAFLEASFVFEGTVCRLQKEMEKK